MKDEKIQKIIIAKWFKARIKICSNYNNWLRNIIKMKKNYEREKKSFWFVSEDVLKFSDIIVILFSEWKVEGEVWNNFSKSNNIFIELH